MQHLRTKGVNNMANINVPDIAVNSLVRMLADMYSAAIVQEISFENLRPAFLWGPPGVGKSQSLKQISDEITKRTGKSVHIRDVRLSNCALTDLVGIPVADKEKKNTVWLRPEIFDFDDCDEDVILLFFDEIDKSAQSIQAAALQLILDRQSWTHKLPDNVILLAAGNPSKLGDEMVVKLRMELANRFRHYYVTPDFESFREWGVANHIHPYVLGFLSYNNAMLYDTNPSQEEIAYATPRSWKSVSDLLYLLPEQSVSDLHYDIAGDVGTGTALEFEAWCKVYSQLPKTEDIFKGAAPNFVKSPDVMYALISSISVYASQHVEQFKARELQHMCRFAAELPVDFASLLYRNLMIIDGMKEKLMRVNEFQIWLQRNKKHLR